MGGDCLPRCKENTARYTWAEEETSGRTNVEGGPLPQDGVLLMLEKVWFQALDFGEKSSGCLRAERVHSHQKN